jgi:hypothetical protein
MARKPIHLQAAGKLTPRDRIWEAIRAAARNGPLGNGISYADIADRVVELAPAEARVRRIEEATIETYVLSLVAAGYMKHVKAPSRALKNCVKNVRFELVRDVGVHAPRVTKTGAPVTQGTSRLSMWRVMRKLRQFTRRELAAKASTEGNPVDEEDAKTYVHYLAKAGYLAVVVPGRPRHLEVYAFVRSRDSGPLAPMIQRVKHVYDPNLGKVVWHPEADA